MRRSTALLYVIIGIFCISIGLSLAKSMERSQDPIVPILPVVPPINETSPELPLNETVTSNETIFEVISNQTNLEMPVNETIIDPLESLINQTQNITEPMLPLLPVEQGNLTTNVNLITGKVPCIGGCPEIPITSIPEVQESVFISAMGRIIASIDAEGIQYYHHDALGSVRAITDETGNVVYSTSYLPFGESLQEEGNSAYTYTGKEEDTTGLLYYGARYYDASLGRFLQPDPVMQAEFTPYAYVENNPLTKIDPDGRRSREIHPNFVETDPFNRQWQVGYFPGAAPSLFLLILEAVQFKHELDVAGQEGEEIFRIANENFWESLEVDLNKPLLSSQGEEVLRPTTEDIFQALDVIYDQAIHLETAEQRDQLRDTWESFKIRTEDRRTFDERGLTLDGQHLDSKKMMDIERSVNTPLPSEKKEKKVIGPGWRGL